MKYYPAFLNLAGRNCVVVGGGEVGTAKCLALVRAGARVTVISPQISPELEALVHNQTLRHVPRTYHARDLEGAQLVIAATDDEPTQAQVAADARQAGVFVNVVDRPALCDFIVPAIVERGDLLIAISTCGRSPILARRIRERLQALFGPEYAQALVLLGKLREQLSEARLPFAERRRIFDALLDSQLIDLLERGDTESIDRLLAEAVGGDVSVDSLGLREALTSPRP